MFDFIDYKSFWTIVHVLGVIIGAGGAFASDLMFFNSVKDRKIDQTEMRFFRLGSKMVWVGIAIIVVSGIFLVSTNIPRHLESSKFLAKMTIVAVIIVNGVIFHTTHIPRLHRHIGRDYSSSKEFVKKAPFL